MLLCSYLCQMSYNWTYIHSLDFMAKPLMLKLSKLVKYCRNYDLFLKRYPEWNLPVLLVWSRPCVTSITHHMRSLSTRTVQNVIKEWNLARWFHFWTESKLALEGSYQTNLVAMATQFQFSLVFDLRFCEEIL